MSLYGHVAQHWCIYCYNCCIGVFAAACVITALCVTTAVCVISTAYVIAAACVIAYFPHACIWWLMLSSVAILQMIWYHLSTNTWTIVEIHVFTNNVNAL